MSGQAHEAITIPHEHGRRTGDFATESGTGDYTLRSGKPFPPAKVLTVRDLARLTAGVSNFIQSRRRRPARRRHPGSPSPRAAGPRVVTGQLGPRALVTTEPPGSRCNPLQTPSLLRFPNRVPASILVLINGTEPQEVSRTTVPQSESVGIQRFPSSKSGTVPSR